MNGVASDDERICPACVSNGDAQRTCDEAMRAALGAVSTRDYARAERLGREILARVPQHDGALSVLGLALFEQGEYVEARDCFEKLTQAAPRKATHWQNLGATLRALRQYDAAAQSYAQAAICGADSARFLHDAALVELDRHQPLSALNLLRRAHRLDPRSADSNVWLAEVCARTARYAEARNVLASWRSYEDLNDELLARIAALLQLLMPGEERHVLQRLGQMYPSASASLLIARIHERGNRLEYAERALRGADARADASLQDELQRMRARLAARRGDHAGACASWRNQLGRAPLRYDDLFAYAKSLDALGRYDEAFTTMQAAHDAQLQELIEWTPEALRADGMAAIAAQECDPRDIAAWSDPDAPSRDQSPIFIVGFPRSGTTLLEQALDAHPRLTSMDEQPFLQQIIDAWRAQGIWYPQGLRNLSRAQLQFAREQYWTLVRSRVDLPRPCRLIDKNPLNLLRLPAIQRLFPNANIVLAVRHPLDVILSCFAQPFASPEFARLCKDPLALAEGYRIAFDCFFRDAGVLGPNVYELSYERLVADFELEMRALCAALEVSWHPSVLDPAANARRKPYISTPSYAEVVRPVHTLAIGRWQHYRARLAAVQPIVQPYLTRWGY